MNSGCMYILLSLVVCYSTIAMCNRGPTTRKNTILHMYALGTLHCGEKYTFRQRKAIAARLEQHTCLLRKAALSDENFEMYISQKTWRKHSEMCLCNIYGT